MKTIIRKIPQLHHTQSFCALCKKNSATIAQFTIIDPSLKKTHVYVIRASLVGQLCSRVLSPRAAMRNAFSNTLAVRRLIVWTLSTALSRKAQPHRTVYRAFTFANNTHTHSAERVVRCRWRRDSRGASSHRHLKTEHVRHTHTHTVGPHLADLRESDRVRFGNVMPNDVPQSAGCAHYCVLHNVSQSGPLTRHSHTRIHTQNNPTPTTLCR